MWFLWAVVAFWFNVDFEIDFIYYLFYEISRINERYSEKQNMIIKWISFVSSINLFGY